MMSCTAKSKLGPSNVNETEVVTVVTRKLYNFLFEIRISNYDRRTMCKYSKCKKINFNMFSATIFANSLTWQNRDIFRIILSLFNQCSRQLIQMLISNSLIFVVILIFESSDLFSGLNLHLSNYWMCSARVVTISKTGSPKLSDSFDNAMTMIAMLTYNITRSSTCLGKPCDYAPECIMEISC
jgi:hypothetical protein